MNFRRLLVTGVLLLVSVVWLAQTSLALPTLAVVDLLPSIAGNYAGLMPDKNALVEATITRQGTYSATLHFQQATLRVSGKLDKNGNALATIKSTETEQLKMSLALSTEDPAVHGFFGANLESPFTLSRLPFNEKSNPATDFVGKYTLVCSSAGSSNAFELPGGWGFFAATVNQSGLMKQMGRLGDGTAFAHATRLLDDGTALLWSRLYKKRGVVFGSITLHPQQNILDWGILQWNKDEDLQDWRPYRLGFKLPLKVTGSSYLPPRGPGERAIQLDETILGITTPYDFPQSFKITFDEKDNVFSAGQTKFRMKINRANGLFSGKLVPSPNSLSPVSGAILQTRTTAFGLYNTSFGEVGGISWEPPIDFAIQLVTNSTLAEQPSSFSITTTGAAESARCDFGDGTAADGFEFSHTWTNVGIYTVQVTVFTKPHPEGLTNTFAVHVEAPPLVVALDPFANIVKPAQPLSLHASVLVGNFTSEVWNFGDGATASGNRFATHSWTNPGTYALSFIALDKYHPLGVSVTSLVYVLEHEIHYVTPLSTNPSPPYLSWDTAATNIQNAIDTSVLPDSLVLVSNGVYGPETVIDGNHPASRVSIGKPMLVQSVNGPEHTFIAGHPGVWRNLFVIPPYTGGSFVDGDIDPPFYVDATSGASVANGGVLSGFTITNGFLGLDGPVRPEPPRYSYFTGGGASCGNSAIVTNCVFIGNQGGMEGGCAIDCVLESNQGAGAAHASLMNCLVSSNSAGGIKSCAATNCLIIGNSSAVLNAGGATSSTLVGCLVAGNSSSITNGGVANCSAWNSIIYYNSAPVGPNFDANSESALFYCCSTPLPAGGIGNLDAEPGFLNLSLNDFHLAPGSPCIDAGLNNVQALPYDLEGNPRIVNGTIDIGPFEFQSP